MKILCHRGCWSVPEEKNTPQALLSALNRGLGIETDVRDSRGELVISHDPPFGHEPSLEWLFEAYARNTGTGTLALNVKADGILRPLKTLLAKYDIADYFLFDMSVPEAYQYLKARMPVFMRQSEFEPTPVFESEAKGIWLDAFLDDWYSLDMIMRTIDGGKMIAIVSPELHGRDHEKLWSMIRTMDKSYLDDLYLCTDKPNEAIDYFDEN